MRLFEEIVLKLEENTAFENTAMMARRAVVGTLRGLRQNKRKDLQVESSN